MKRIWAPWRMSFILGYDKNACIFCDLPKQPPDKDRENLILKRGKRVFVIMNRFPYNNGHLMVCPFEHKAKISDLDTVTLHELIEWVKFSNQTVEKALSCEGLNVGLNQGKISGAGYAGHAHFHIVPRWSGDTNFMPVIGQTKVMSEYLENTYDRLIGYFK